MQAGVASNLAVLVFYKYLNFLLSTLHTVMSNAGIKNNARHLELMVPLGISFVLFQTISYIVDVYRQEIKAEHSVLKFALYVSFFPKVVQGPIARAGDVLPQFDEVHHFEMRRFRSGSLMVLYGLFMKMVIADRLAIIVNTAYSAPASYSGAAFVFATVMFAIQIYCDFAGYSLIAIGAAKLLGFELKRNFRQPYLSTSVGEFWRRWHISLNDWLRDYIYIPLGGSRCSNARRYWNLLITFAISGLWHGASWGYIFWGLLNGLYVVMETYVGTFRKSHGKEGDQITCVKPNLFIVFFKRIRTFILVTIAWTFFRAQSLSLSVTVFDKIIHHFNLNSFLSWTKGCLAKGPEANYFGLGAQEYIVILVSLLICLTVDLIADRYDLVKKVTDSPVAIRWTIYFALIFGVLIFGVYGYGYSAGAFIYTLF